jgi:hypothetical protein
VLAVFDFKSARVSYRRVKLMDRSQKIGVKGKMLKWFCNFIT